ncbi:hypothetical protein AB0F96_26895 [Streptomyces sp. NPDC023998]|uniref:hypothetical protein n=1 Tax=Streptomyces sp. NPDC023998 TaxID=3154597 RepID=UPI0033EF4216
MATTHRTAETARAVTDHEAYSFVAELFSLGMAEGIKKTLKKLEDPDIFAQAVRDAAREQSLVEDSVPDPMDLYNGFWTLYTGTDMNFNWRNDAGVPSRSVLTTEQLKAVQQPVSLDDGQPRSKNFGISLGFMGASIGVEF